jgi:hypothetical protein
MLYKLVQTEPSQPLRLEPQKFHDFDKEKNLENLLAENMLESLRLMPIFQERSWQSEADIYALDKQGNLVLFELKRTTAEKSALLQIFGYVQEAQKWNFNEIEDKYKTYTKDLGRIQENKGLLEEHQENFNLSKPLPEEAINQNQRLIIMGNAIDKALQDTVAYWKNKGVWVEFLPYRLYQIGEESYFELFTPPYDYQSNPADCKGVFFNTNRSYNEDDIWDMMENNRVMAYNEAQKFIYRLGKKDTVFFFHKWVGVVAAAKVISEAKTMKVGDRDVAYCDVQFLTSKPSKDSPIKALTCAEAKRILGKNFWWATTIPVPYLSKEETELLLSELTKKLNHQEVKL